MIVQDVVVEAGGTSTVMKRTFASEEEEVRNKCYCHKVELEVEVGRECYVD
jgi:hypothetical protein